MTGKQKAMITERLKDKTASNAEIIKRAGYRVNGVQTASQIYLENMKKPEIASKLNDVVEEMEEVLTTTVRRYRNSDKLPEVILANDNAKWIHDKVAGKATQRIEQTTTGVTLTIDLTSALADTTPDVA
jgi:phage terminase small subunit